MNQAPPIVAVCGKGGVGKTALSALLARALMERGVRPLLLVDADPAGGLCAAVGKQPGTTLAVARERLVAAARTAAEPEREALADQLDYLLQETLLERDGFALLAMGHSRDKGCYCPANTLVRQAVASLSRAFAAVLIDAEAGIEQISRQVTRDVTLFLCVTDGSARSLHTMEHIVSLAGDTPAAAVANRVQDFSPVRLPRGIPLLGEFPEDDQIRAFDQQGRTLWELPQSNAALAAARAVARRIMQNAQQIAMP